MELDELSQVREYHRSLKRQFYVTLKIVINNSYKSRI